MTTTLRPEGPAGTNADGGRSRDFRICVNGRQVGTLRLATDVRFGARTGRIELLAVDPAERRRGRATVAALAAEEVLRGWDCTHAEACVPASAGAALALARALGYAERDRVLAKRLTALPPAPPPGSVVRPLAADDFPAWLAGERAWYAGSLAGRGLPPGQAEARADDVVARLLPDGPASRGAALRVLTHAGRPVGSLWLALPGAPPPPGLDGYVYAVRVHEGQRGRGHGRTLMREAERICHSAGGRRLGLTVVADNAPALALYESLGYRVLERCLSKPLA